MNEKFLVDVLEAVKFYTVHFPEDIPVHALDDIQLDGRYATRREVRAALHELKRRGIVEVEGSGDEAATWLVTKDSPRVLKRTRAKKGERTRTVAIIMPRKANSPGLPMRNQPPQWTPRAHIVSMGQHHKTATINTNSPAAFNASYMQVEKKYPGLEWMVAEVVDMPHTGNLDSLDDLHRYAGFWEVLDRDGYQVFHQSRGDAEKAISALWEASQRFDGPNDALDRWGGAVGTNEEYAGRLADDAGGVAALLGERLEMFIDWDYLGEQLLLESANTPGGDSVINGHLFRHS
jgi:hypothetical protein